MSELASTYSSLSMAFHTAPEALQPVFRAAIRAIEEHAAQQPGYESMLEACLDDIQTRLSAGETIQRKNYADPLVATIALFQIVGPISWLELGPSRARVR